MYMIQSANIGIYFVIGKENCYFCRKIRIKQRKMDDIRFIPQLVRTFFQHYAMALIMKEGHPEYVAQPKEVKRIIAAHFEEIAPRFHETILYPLVSLNYGSAEAFQKVIQGQPITDYLTLIRFACRTEAMHSAMVEAYRDNITHLLQGTLPENPADGSSLTELQQQLLIYIKNSDFASGKA